MSVLMTLRVKGDATKLEALTKDEPTLFAGVSGRGKEYGATYHRFYATDDELLVVDEWPDERSFQDFFEASPEIPGIMARAGATAAPEIRFWRRLDLGDEIG